MPCDHFPLSQVLISEGDRPVPVESNFVSRGPNISNWHILPPSNLPLSISKIPKNENMSLGIKLRWRELKGLFRNRNRRSAPMKFTIRDNLSDFFQSKPKNLQERQLQECLIMLSYLAGDK
jgi:hypothetical protein